MNTKDHWENVYSSKPRERLGWFKPHLQTSLTWIEALGLGEDAPIIDIGGGASTLVDDLLDAGYKSITILDHDPRHFRQCPVLGQSAAGRKG
jgi:hypothetical protein